MQQLKCSSGVVIDGLEMLGLPNNKAPTQQTVMQAIQEIVQAQQSELVSGNEHIQLKPCNVRPLERLDALLMARASVRDYWSKCMDRNHHILETDPLTHVLCLCQFVVEVRASADAVRARAASLRASCDQELKQKQEKPSKQVLQFVRLTPAQLAALPAKEQKAYEETLGKWQKMMDRKAAQDLLNKLALMDARAAKGEAELESALSVVLLGPLPKEVRGDDALEIEACAGE